eukprot:scaffold84557_cov56-Phaeocystis_antarctica.AAC.5
MIRVGRRHSRAGLILSLIIYPCSSEKPWGESRRTLRARALLAFPTKHAHAGAHSRVPVRLASHHARHQLAAHFRMHARTHARSRPPPLTITADD